MTRRPALHGVLIFAPDLEVGVAFYRDVLGFEVVRRSDSHVAMRGAGFDLTIFKCETAGSPDGYSSRAGSSIAFAVPDVAESMAELELHGVEFLHQAPSVGPVGRYVAFVDPFGTVHELVDSNRDHSTATPEIAFSHRLATLADLPSLEALMEKAIRQLLGATLDTARVEASFEVMGVDTQLIEDGTYFAIECEGQLVGCGGWSRRATLFGGDHSEGRDGRLLDPAVEPARVRAMYTHPNFARRGIGRLVLSLCESAAAREGFRSLELAATVAGEPLYSAYGFSLIERVEVSTSTGVTVPLARMSKPVKQPRTS